MLLILELSLVGAVGLFIYAFCICCHNKVPVVKLKKQNEQIGQLISPIKSGIYRYNDTPGPFPGLEGNFENMDIDQLKERLE